MDRINITREEYAHYSLNIAQRFEQEIVETESESNITTLQNSGVTISRYKKADDVNNISLDDMPLNSVNFYSKTAKGAFFSLLKHFRNCASHKNRIFHASVNDVDVIVFEDSIGNKASMRAIISANCVDDVLNVIFQAYLNGIENNET